MPGIGSQVNLEDVGFTYRKRQPRDNLMATMMIAGFVEEQARQNEHATKQDEQLSLLMASTLKQVIIHLPHHIARAQVSTQIHPSPTPLIPPKLLPYCLDISSSSSLSLSLKMAFTILF
ncbi:hypothetical protein SLEP1_g9308 [Rubroshorea leprosula]|uniref:Uncharacterized protein n=1 Tax=Rubroshorea leprosula TaxID=152421 RepID=A0AAV5IAI5_9ROSI|nr:hypothetical protein SLEP1_g9308 [Rubroshorea leprosula]